MFSRFFIERPIFANVIAIVTMLIGAVTLFVLPIEQYPNVTPPTVQVMTNYPGANAQVLSDTVASPIEQEVNGVEDMLYMSSTCSSDGTYTLTVTFEVGTDLDQAQVLVQNRLTAALPRLPQEVQRQGVTAKKQSTSIILVVALSSPDGRYDSLFMSNFATLQVRDVLSRIYGVGDIVIFGSSNYGMRIWIDPEKLQARNLTTEDVLAAIREQNVQVAAGQVGQSPTPQDQNFQYTVTTLGRLSDPEQFGEIIVKTAEEGRQGARLTLVKDVARVELGAQVLRPVVRGLGQARRGPRHLPAPRGQRARGGRRVRAAMEELKQTFPQGLEYSIPFDTTIFVEESIHEVYKTLFEAGVLVLIVILLFLQDWRALLIPATTVPVTIIGAFAAMGALGFSVNMLTLFGLVLAIGIVVDDAIVIVENAVHHIDRDGMRPEERDDQGDVRGDRADHRHHAGADGRLPADGLPRRDHRPALPPVRPHHRRHGPHQRHQRRHAQAGPVRRVPPALARAARTSSTGPSTPSTTAANGRTRRSSGDVVRHPVAMLVLYVGLVGVTGWWFTRLPTGFLPTEDQGYAVVAIQLPDAASQVRTREVVGKVSDDPARDPRRRRLGHDRRPVDPRAGDRLQRGGDLRHLDPLGGADGPPRAEPGRDPRQADGEVRRDPGGDGLRVRPAGDLRPRRRRGLRDAGPEPRRRRARGTPAGRRRDDRRRQRPDDPQGRPVPLPVRRAAGLHRRRSGQGQEPGRPARRRSSGRSRRRSARPTSTTSTSSAGPIRSASRPTSNSASGPRTSAAWRSATGRGRWSRSARSPRSRSGSARRSSPATTSTLRRSITGEAAPGYSSGQALKIMEQMAAQQAAGVDGIRMDGDVVPGEAGRLAVDLRLRPGGADGLPRARRAVRELDDARRGDPGGPAGPAGDGHRPSRCRGMDNNVYTQIGIVLIIALASKNAILIVEFARELRARGRPIVEAAVEASRLRFRPILMTSFAFILGIYPLVNASGAGAASRRALGTAVFGGMIAATVLAVFFVPVFYVVMQRLSEFRSKDRVDAPTPAEPSQDHRVEALAH